MIDKLDKIIKSRSALSGDLSFAGKEHRLSFPTRLSERPPIFVHSSFRTGSTWLFSKFRCCDTTYCYYEIFHERLNDITEDVLIAFGPRSWESNHPPGAPYFNEFRPLLRAEGGVHGFSAFFPYIYMMPQSGPGGDISEAEARYVKRLIEFARVARKTPVLTGCRTLPRIAGLKRRFGGIHVVLQRDLWSQWASYCTLHDAGSFYFVNSILEILANARHDFHQDRLFRRHVSARSCRDGSTIIRFEDWDAALKAFFSMHAYHYLIAFQAADLVFDISAAAKDRELALAFEREIARETGLRIDLSDLNLPLPHAGAARGKIDGWALAYVEEAKHAARVSIRAEARLDRLVENWPAVEQLNQANG